VSVPYNIIKHKGNVENYKLYIYCVFVCQEIGARQQSEPGSFAAYQKLNRPCSRAAFCLLLCMHAYMCILLMQKTRKMRASFTCMCVCNFSVDIIKTFLDCILGATFSAENCICAFLHLLSVVTESALDSIFLIYVFLISRHKTSFSSILSFNTARSLRVRVIKYEI
jgi:hypothetical protein